MCVCVLSYSVVLIYMVKVVIYLNHLKTCRCFRVYVDSSFWYPHSVEELVIWTVEREKSKNYIFKHIHVHVGGGYIGTLHTDIISGSPHSSQI